MHDSFRKTKKAPRVPNYKPQLGYESVGPWLELVAELLKTEYKETHKNPEDLVLGIVYWSRGDSIRIPKGAEIFFPNQTNATHPNANNPKRNADYVMVYLDDCTITLKKEDGVVSFAYKRRIPVVAPYQSGVPFPVHL